MKNNDIKEIWSIDHFLRFQRVPEGILIRDKSQGIGDPRILGRLNHDGFLMENPYHLKMVDGKVVIRNVPHFGDWTLLASWVIDPPADLYNMMKKVIRTRSESSPMERCQVFAHALRGLCPELRYLIPRPLDHMAAPMLEALWSYGFIPLFDDIKEMRRYERIIR